MIQTSGKNGVFVFIRSIPYLHFCPLQFLMISDSEKYFSGIGKPKNTLENITLAATPMCQSKKEYISQHPVDLDRVAKWWENMMILDLSRILGSFHLLYSKMKHIDIKNYNITSTKVNDLDALGFLDCQQLTSTSTISSKKEVNKKPVSSTCSSNKNTSCTWKHELEVWSTELSNTKHEIQQYRSIYNGYIQTLSSFILYTKIIMILLYSIIVIILVAYPRCIYLYFYYINTLFMIE